MIFRFSAFELSPASEELRKHGILVRLSPQPFQVLTLLVQRAGQVVSRDDLRERLWGHDGTSVEFDAGLNRCIRQIRAALNDDADTPRYIETIPRKGYRFIAPVDKAPVQETPFPEPAPATPMAARHPPAWMLLAVLSLVGAVAVLWLFSSRSRLSPNLNSVPLASAPGDQVVPTFSPDGRQVAFVWNGPRQDNFDIYLKLIGSSSAPLRLTTSADVDYSPAWSPDGRWIAFCRGSGSRGGAVLVVPALGGVERKVVDLYALAAPFNRSLSWSSDSRSLVVADPLRGKTREGLFLVNMETGDSRQITEPGRGEVDMHPAVSPDGRTIAFTRDYGGGVSSIMTLPFAEGKPPRALPDPISAMQSGKFYSARPAWTPDSTHIVFASNAGGIQHLWLVSATGSSAPVELAALGVGAQDAAVSAKGQVAFMHETFDSNIWRVDLNTLSSGSPQSMPVAASTRVEQDPAVSPDGARIAFQSNLSGYSEIWTSRSDGSYPVQLTSLQNPVTGSPDWSPDGSQILFDSRAGGQPQIYIIPADGGKPSRLTSENASDVVPQWSPDGRSVYYSSDRTGRMEIWQMPAAGGAAHQITFDGGFAAALSRDGESLYYRSSNSIVSPLWELRLATGKRTLVNSSVGDHAYAAASAGVYFFAGAVGEAKHSFFFFDKRSFKRTE